MTKEQAIKMVQTRWWEDVTPYQAAWFQLNEDRLCMPFNEFHRCIEIALDRSVWTHEFAFRDGLIQEWKGDKPKATMEDILDLLPAGKVIVITS